MKAKSQHFLSILHTEAVRVRELAHAPYSKFKVGAALQAKSGKVFSGCNVENASYGGTVCAERTAIFKAVSTGDKQFTRIVVVTNAKKPAPPCGFCLQVLAEFCDDNFEVVLATPKKVHSRYKLKQLLPKAFRSDYL